MQNFNLSNRFLDALPTPMVISRNGTILYSNPPAKKLFQDAGITLEVDLPLPAPLAAHTEAQMTQVPIGGRLWELTVQPQETETLYLLSPIAFPQRETMAQLAHQLRIRFSRLTLSAEGLQTALGDFLQHQHRKWIAREELYLHQLQRLTEDLEFMSCSNEDLEVLYPASTVDLVELCSETETLLSDLGETIGRRSTFRCAMGEYPVKANPELLRKLLFQLASNSFEAKGDVNLLLKKQGSTALLYFSDTGSGISPAALPTLFSPELHPDTADSKSMGLGLSICRRIALLYGGTLTLLPQPNGTKFILSLPLVNKGKAPVRRSTTVDEETAREQALTELSDLLPYQAFEKRFGE